MSDSSLCPTKSSLKSCPTLTSHQPPKMPPPPLPSSDVSSTVQHHQHDHRTESAQVCIPKPEHWWFLDSDYKLETQDRLMRHWKEATRIKWRRAVPYLRLVAKLKDGSMDVMERQGCVFDSGKPVSQTSNRFSYSPFEERDRGISQNG